MKNKNNNNNNNINNNLLINNMGGGVWLPNPYGYLVIKNDGGFTIIEINGGNHCLQIKYQNNNIGFCPILYFDNTKINFKGGKDAFFEILEEKISSLKLGKKFLNQINYQLNYPLKDKKDNLNKIYYKFYGEYLHEIKLNIELFNFIKFIITKNIKYNIKENSPEYYVLLKGDNLHNWLMERFHESKAKSLERSLISTKQSRNEVEKMGEDSKVTLCFYRGVTELAPLSSRYLDDESKGIFDPIWTPESSLKIGLNRHLLPGVKIDEDGHILNRSKYMFTPVYNHYFKYNDCKRNLLSVAQSESTLSKTMGKIIFSPCYGYTHEDSIVVSKELADKLAYNDKPLMPGDKLAGDHGNKGVVSMVINEVGSFMFNDPTSLIKRGIWGVLFEQFNDPLGLNLIKRLDHNVIDKIKSYNNEKISKMTGMPVNGVFLGAQEIYSLFAHNAKNVINALIKNNEEAYSYFEIFMEILSSKGIKKGDEKFNEIIENYNCKEIKNSSLYKNLTKEEAVIKILQNDFDGEPAEGGLLDMEDNVLGYYVCKNNQVVFLPPKMMRPIFDSEKFKNNKEDIEEDINEENVNEDKFILGSINILASKIIDADKNGEDVKNLINNYYYGAENQYHNSIFNIIFKKNHLLKKLFGLKVNGGNSVITVNPSLNIDEVAIPSTLMNLMKIKNGEYVLLTRAPALHKQNILAMKAKDGGDNLSLQINPFICEGMNGDFDGDQMRFIKIENNELTLPELERMNPKNKSTIRNIADGSYYGMPTKSAGVGLCYLYYLKTGKLINKKNLYKYINSLSEDKYVSQIKKFWRVGFKYATQYFDKYVVNYESMIAYKAMVKEAVKDAKTTEAQEEAIKNMAVDINNPFSYMFYTGFSGKANHVNYSFGKGAINGKCILDNLSRDEYFQLCKNIIDGLGTSKILVGQAGTPMKMLLAMAETPKDIEIVQCYASVIYQAALDAKHGNPERVINNVKNFILINTGELTIDVKFSETTNVKVVRKTTDKGEETDYVNVSVYSCQTKELLGQYKVYDPIDFTKLYKQKFINEQVRYYTNEEGKDIPCSEHKAPNKLLLVKNGDQAKANQVIAKIPFIELINPKKVKQFYIDTNKEMFEELGATLNESIIERVFELRYKLNSKTNKYEVRKTNRKTNFLKYLRDVKKPEQLAGFNGLNKEILGDDLVAHIIMRRPFTC